MISISNLRRLILILLLILLGAALSIANPSFLKMGNIMTLLQEAALYGIVALGLTFVLITAEIDISIGGIIAFTSMVCVNFLVYTRIPVPLFIPAAIAVGALIGLFNGYFITRFKLPDFPRHFLQGLRLVFIQQAEELIQIQHRFMTLDPRFDDFLEGFQALDGLLGFLGAVPETGCRHLLIEGFDFLFLTVQVKDTPGSLGASLSGE